MNSSVLTTLESLESKKWQLSVNGLIEDEEGQFVAVLPENVSAINRRIIEGAPQFAYQIAKFVSDVRNGSHKPRTAVKQMEQLLEKYDLC